MLFPKETLNFKTISLLAICSAIYLSLIAILVEIKTENILLVGVFNMLFLISDSTRKFISAFAIFIVFGIVYDLMKAFPNYSVNVIDILPIYNLEKILFGIHSGASILTPNEYFAIHNNAFFDVVSGLFYINWIPIPLGLGLYFYLKDKRQFLYFSLTFLLTNLIGFTLYYVHPAAPPWYLAQFGTEALFNIPGNPAGLIRFDHFFDVPLFQSIYSRNSNVFAAMPSLHSAYPIVVLYFGVKNKLGLINWFFGLFVIGIWFSAVYSGHHYLLDVIAGALTAIFGIWLFQYVVIRKELFNKTINKYLAFIS